MVSHWLPKRINKQCMNTQTFIFFLSSVNPYTNFKNPIHHSFICTIYLETIKENQWGIELAGEWNLNSVLDFEKHSCSCAARTVHWERKPSDKAGERAAFGVCGNGGAQVCGRESLATYHWSSWTQSSELMKWLSHSVKELPPKIHFRSSTCQYYWGWWVSW